METLNNINPTLIGNLLLKRGYKDWFLYLFRIINGRPFRLSPIYDEIFNIQQRIIDGTDTRIIKNICPRSGKTTDGIYSCVYALLNNPKSQIIYTSYNSDLLKEVANQIATILQHPAFLAMYPKALVADIQDTETKASDPWWEQYARQVSGKPTFSTRKITTPQGGIILFSSIGSAIVGFGAGVRDAKGFSGKIIIDDPDKPTDIRSAKIREKTHTYFEETLLSRLNNPNTPIEIIQQRLHLDDLSGFVKEKYGFKQYVFPLLNADGTCNLPDQYTPERIHELQINNYVFQAQYQQNPLILGGGVIKHDWWRYYKDAQDTRYNRLFITADTANKTKEWNDYTAIGVWGFTAQRKLRLLDLIHAKLEIPELQATFLALWDKWKAGINGTKLTKIIIEDKASGTQVIQQLSRGYGLPIVPYIPDKDKLTRMLDAVPQIVAGNVELPESENHPLSRELLAETDAFSADFSHPHDDLCDCLSYAINESFNQRGYF